MKTVAEIKAKIAEINADERRHPTAFVQTNAPLALIQVSLTASVNALAWVLGINPPSPRTKKKRK